MKGCSPELLQEGDILYKLLAGNPSPERADMNRLADIGNALFQHAVNGDRDTVTGWFALLNSLTDAMRTASEVGSVRTHTRSEFEKAVTLKNIKRRESAKKPTRERPATSGMLLEKNVPDETEESEFDAHSKPYSAISPIELLDRISSLQRHQAENFSVKEFPALLPMARTFTAANDFDQLNAASAQLGTLVLQGELPASIAQHILLVIGIHRYVPDEDRARLLETLITSTRAPQELEEESMDEELAFEAWLARHAEKEAPADTVSL